MDQNNLLNGIEDTLYIPLLARIYASEKFPDFFYDEKAISLKRYIPTNNIESTTNEYFYMASVCRQYSIDKKIIKFIEKNIEGNVVFLGAGLETAYNRIKNNKINFFQVDLQNVINTRKKVLGNGENERLIAGDMFTLDWIEEVDLSLPTMIVVSGVYQYFQKEKVVNMIKGMKSFIINGELIFDTTNSTGLKLANKYVRKTGNMNAVMNFSVDNPIDFAKITETKLVGVYGYFDDAMKYCNRLSYKTKIYMYFADKLKRTMIIHLKFN